MNTQTDSERLSGRGKRIALLFILLGLLTFLFPIIRVDPPVHGQQYWSILDIVLQWQSQSPAMNPVAMFLFLPFGPVYLVLLLALGVIVLIPLRKVLRWISLAGLFFLYPFRGIFGGIRLVAFFELGHRGGDLRTLWLVLGVMVAAITVVAWTDTTA